MGKVALLKRGRPRAILDEVIAAVSRWEEFAAAAGVAGAQAAAIKATHRLDWRAD